MRNDNSIFIENKEKGGFDQLGTFTRIQCDKLAFNLRKEFPKFRIIILRGALTE